MRFFQTRRSFISARCKRLRALAPGHMLEPYLRFAANVTEAQHEIQAGLSEPVLPPFDQMREALANEMPPVGMTAIDLGEDAEIILNRLLERLRGGPLTPEARAAVESLASSHCRKTLSAPKRRCQRCADRQHRRACSYPCKPPGLFFAASLEARRRRSQARCRRPLSGVRQPSLIKLRRRMAKNRKFEILHVLDVRDHVECRAHQMRVLQFDGGYHFARPNIRAILAKMRHEGCGGLAGKAELLTGIEGVSSRPVRKISTSHVRGSMRAGSAPDTKTETCHAPTRAPAMRPHEIITQC